MGRSDNSSPLFYGYSFPVFHLIVRRARPLGKKKNIIDCSAISGIKSVIALSIIL